MFEMNYKEWTLAAITGILVYSVFGLFGTWKNPKPVIEVNESYEMPRPQESYLGAFDLSRRGVEYRVVGRRQPMGQVPANVPVNVPGTVAPPNAKAAPAKSKIDPKKKAQEVAAKKKAYAQAEARRKKSMLVRTLGEDRKGLSRTDSVTQTNSNPDQVQRVANGVPVAQPVNNISDDKPEKEKISPGLWLSRLQSQPLFWKKEFMTARKELGDADYYDIILKLLKDSQADRSKVALDMVKMDSSPQGFAFAVKIPADLASRTDLKRDLDNYKSSFTVKPRVGSLARVLLDIPEKQVVMAALEMIAGLRTSSAPSTETPSSTGGSAAITTLTDKDFASYFRGPLAALAKSKDATIASAAKTIYSARWPTSNTAVAGN